MSPKLLLITAFVQLILFLLSFGTVKAQPLAANYQTFIADLLVANNLATSLLATQYAAGYCNQTTPAFGPCTTSNPRVIQTLILDCGIAGAISNIPPSIRNATTLRQSLTIASCNFDDSIDLPNNLYSFILKNVTSFTRIPPSACQSSLGTLAITNSIFSSPWDPSCLANMTNLETVAIAYVRMDITSLSVFGSMNNLTLLDLRANPLLSAPFATQICGLQKLRNIFLSNTNLNGSLDTCIQNMQLDRFDISYTSVTGFLPNLCQFYLCKEVDFTKTQLTGTVPLSIWTNVTFGLSLKRVGITGEPPVFDIPVLPAQLNPLVESIFMRMLSINASIPSEWGQLSNLKVLVIPGSNLNGTLPDFSRTNLTTLDLSGSKITGELFSKLPTRKMMDVLVDNNRFQGALPADLGLLFSSRLRTFQIRGNLFNGTLPNSLVLLKPTTTLLLELNNFTGCIPPFNYTYFKQPSRGCSLNRTPLLCCPPPAINPSLGTDVCGLTLCDGTGQLVGEIPCPLPSPGNDYSCVNGSWAIVSDVVIPGNTTIIFPPQTVTIIVGSLTLTNTSTLQISPSTTVVVTECATLSGSLIVEFNASEAVVTRMTKTQEILKFDPACSSGNFTSVKAIVAGCANYTVDSSVSYRSGSVLFTYDFKESHCNSAASPSTQLEIDSNWRVITGSVVGAVLGLAVIVTVVILVVPALRFKVFPFMKIRETSVRQTNLDD